MLLIFLLDKKNELFSIATVRGFFQAFSTVSWSIKILQVWYRQVSKGWEGNDVN